MNLIELRKLRDEARRLNDKIKTSCLSLLISEVEREVLGVKKPKNETNEIYSKVKSSIESNTAVLNSKGASEETIQKLTTENNILSELLPKKLSLEQLKTVIMGLIESNPSINKGGIMGQLKTKYPNMVDNNQAIIILKELGL